MEHICENCGIQYEKQYRKKVENRRKFCSQLCYRLFNAKYKKQRDHHDLYDSFKRLIWGSTGLTQGGIEEIKSFDFRKFELIAKNKLLNKFGFKKITDMNEVVSGYHFDFVAEHKSKKVFVDVTTKYRTNATIKKRLADILGIDLYILFISPEHEGLYYLHKMATPTYKIPIQFFKDEALRRNLDIAEYFMTRP